MEFLTEQYDLPDIFIDSAVTYDNDNILFLSAWGSEARIQQFKARVALPKNDQDSLRELYFIDNEKRLYFYNSDNLESKTCRAPQSLLANLTQIWIYDRLLVKADKVNRRLAMLKRKEEDEQMFNKRIWQAVKTVSHIPLLHEWKNLLEELKECKLVQKFMGFGIDACLIDLGGDALENLVTGNIMRKKLSIPN